MPISKIQMNLLNSFSTFKQVINSIERSPDGKNIISNYGNWCIKYKGTNNIEGFVTADGIIDMNGKKILIKPDSIIETEEKEKQPLFSSIIAMLEDMIKNVNNPEVVNRKHNFLCLDIKSLLDTASQALREIPVSRFFS